MTGLNNRLKQRRRPNKLRQVRRAGERLVPPVKKSPSIKALEVSEVPDGEDDTSFDRHNRVLKTEYSKPSKNVTNVKQLMKITYPMRRREILSNGHSKDYNPVELYPFLQDPKHVRTVRCMYG